MEAMAPGSKELWTTTASLNNSTHPRHVAVEELAVAGIGVDHEVGSQERASRLLSRSITDGLAACAMESYKRPSTSVSDCSVVVRYGRTR